MAQPGTLVQSSPTTRAWLSELRRLLTSLDYRERKYWATFRRNSSSAPCAYLNPSHSSVRLFLRLEIEEDARLIATPSTNEWAEKFPAVFRIEKHSDLAGAAQLIQKSLDRMK